MLPHKPTGDDLGSMRKTRCRESCIASMHARPPPTQTRRACMPRFLTFSARTLTAPLRETAKCAFRWLPTTGVPRSCARCPVSLVALMPWRLFSICPVCMFAGLQN